ncbi:MAG: PopZ family protein [Hyphomicrobium sp.]
MDHSAEASMEEILASIRRIIAAEPKAVMAFADEHFQKFSNTPEQLQSLSSEKAETSLSSDFSDKKISQDHAQKAEPSFSSLSAQPLSSRKLSQNLASKPTAQRYVQALDDDLAGLIETPLPARHETKKDVSVNDAASENVVNDQSCSNISDSPSKDFIPTKNIQPSGKDAQVKNAALSPTAEDPSKKEPSFYSSLTSKDFLKKEDFLSTAGTSSSVFAMKPKDLLDPPNTRTPTFVEEVLANSASATDKPLSEKGHDASLVDLGEKRETAGFWKPLEEISPLKEDLMQKEISIKSASTQNIEPKEENLQTLSQQVSQRSFEDVVSEMLKPMLEKWIEKNLPHLVPKLLKTDNS